eukprot:CAMPEP_0197524154 /NCGR_PEP_ID=MMETSP1318-20131121/8905_1 /TAXON_ID=552666 /ORGANISM="Partenskyella glossopodia, Strain RCC365" /LENGTH=108 /DNA_ID=CAMNT_0043077037 /DNA_START=153 /DNA_END=479 /DNA_ORIENTATION=-
MPRVAGPRCVRPSFAVRAEAAAAPRPVIRQNFEGRVISDKMMKSAVVRVERLVKHPKYHKRMRLSKNFIVDDPENAAEIGDTVRIGSIKPKSKTKSFEIMEVVRKAIK